MSVLIYSLLTFSVCITAICLSRRWPDKISNQIPLKYKMPLLNMLTITLILSYYSAWLGADWSFDRGNYIKSFLVIYPRIYSSIEGLKTSWVEPGFLLINFLIKLFTDDPFWFFFWITFTASILSLYALSKMSGKYYKVCVLLYMSSLFFFQGTYLLRQVTAVSFVSLAIVYYFDNKKLRCLAALVLACSIHSTALIMVPLYFVYRYMAVKDLYVLFFALSITVFMLWGPMLRLTALIVPKMTQYIYLDVYADLEGTLLAPLKGLPYYFIAAFAIAKRKALKKTMYQSDFYVFSSVFLSVCWLFAGRMYWTFRIGWYLMLPTLALIPELLKTIKNTKERLLVYIAFFAVLFSITLRQVYITIR